MATKFPKIGLALSAGGARGIAQIAVIEELEKAGIPIDIIAGSSAGALVSACYGLGTLPELKNWLLSLRQRNIWQFFDVGLSSKGLVKGRVVAAKIKQLTRKKKLEQGRIPIGIVTSDLKTGQTVVFQKGKPSISVRASMAMPVLLQSVKINGQILLDGGLTQYLPAKTCYEMGADLVIGVDCSLKNNGVWEKIFTARGKWQEFRKELQKKERWPKFKKKDIGFWELITNSLDIYSSQNYQKNPPVCDYLIRVELDLQSISIYRAKEALEEGQRVGRIAAKEIKNLLKEKYGVKTA